MSNKKKLIYATQVLENGLIVLKAKIPIFEKSVFEGFLFHGKNASETLL